MNAIPSSLSWMFPNGYTPWAPIYDPGNAPPAVTTNITLDLQADLFIDEGEVFYASHTIDTFTVSWSFPDIVNRGVMWIEGSDNVVAISGYNMGLIENYGVVNAYSSQGTARGVSISSWGVLHNYGDINAASYSDEATGFVTFSTGKADNAEFHINTGNITVWSGQYGVAGVRLENGGRFDNSGDIIATGYSYATAIGVRIHEAVINNT
ncbi:MAG: hypothetical protein AAFR74_04645, partial [Pseudomonadota bacterium]